MWLFGQIAPLLTWLLTLFIPGRNAALMYRECVNKCHVMILVQNIRSYVDNHTEPNIEQLLTHCSALGAHDELWAVEGVGKDIAEWMLKYRPDALVNLFSSTKNDLQWEKGLLMLHAGMGLGFAKNMIEQLPQRTNYTHLAAGLASFHRLCTQNSRTGYQGAALESLGLASRFMHGPAFCRNVHEILVEQYPDTVGYFWRGVGRCLYFHPLSFFPSYRYVSRAVAMCRAEAPTPEIQAMMQSGIAWALTLVNLVTPSLMEWVVRNRDAFGLGEPSFQAGIQSCLVMRYETTRDLMTACSPTARAYFDHGQSVRNTLDLYDEALMQLHPALKRNNCLDEVFRYQSLIELSKRLEAKEQANSKLIV
jgi:hypothetical protein